MSKPGATLVMLLALASPSAVTGAEWVRHTDPVLGFSIALPEDGWQRQPGGDGRLQLLSADREVQLDVFGVDNTTGMPFAEFAEMIVAADPRRVITYRAGGDRWIVLSGYLGDEGAGRDTIFYAKFIGARDGRSLSAFEISYPRSDKAEMDAVVTRIEKSLTGPRR